MENPRLVLVFSGKRKSGKDFVTDILEGKLTFTNERFNASN